MARNAVLRIALAYLLGAAGARRRVRRPGVGEVRMSTSSRREKSTVGAASTSW